MSSRVLPPHLQKGAPRPRHYDGRNSALTSALENDYDPTFFRTSERPLDRRICELAMQGFTNKEIGEMVGRNPITVSIILRQPYARKYMITETKRTASEEVKNLIEKAAVGAVQRVIHRAENHADAKLGADADAEILNRFMGKPVQPVTNPDPSKLDKLSDAALAEIVSGKS